MATPWDINARIANQFEKRGLMALQQAFGIEDAQLQQRNMLARMQEAKNLDLEYNPQIEAAVYGARQPFTIAAEDRAEQRDVRSDERDITKDRRVRENVVEVEEEAYKRDPEGYLRRKRGKVNSLDNDDEIHIPFADELGQSNREVAEETIKGMPDPENYVLELGRNEADKGKASWIIRKKPAPNNPAAKAFDTLNKSQVPSANPEETLRKKQQLLDAAERDRKFWVQE